MSNELSTPKILVCPSDDTIAHTNFLVVPKQMINDTVPSSGGQYSMCNLNVSYYLGKDATEDNPQMFLTGDRNIFGNFNAPPYDATKNGGYGDSPDHAGATTAPGSVQYMSTNWPTANPSSPCWTSKMHQTQGNIGLSDGSVQSGSSSALRGFLRNTGDTSTTPGPNTLFFP